MRSGKLLGAAAAAAAAMVVWGVAAAAPAAASESRSFEPGYAMSKQYVAVTVYKILRDNAPDTIEGCERNVKNEPDRFNDLHTAAAFTRGSINCLDKLGYLQGLPGGSTTADGGSQGPGSGTETPHDAGTPLVAIESAAPLVTSGSFYVDLNFSKPVTGLSRSDIAVVNGRAASLTGSRARYTARIEPAADGTVMVSLPAGAVRADDGSPNAASAPFIRTAARTARPDPPGIDTWNRPLVQLHAWAEFSRQEPDWQFTGDLSACVAGTTSQEFRNSVIQRVNWYRQMAGTGTVTEDPELSANAQMTALMMLAEEDLSHYPSRDWPCHSNIGAATAAKSNIGLGRAGVAGIDLYMRDHGDNNLPVGHRRWILYPQRLEMGTGNMRAPQGASTPTANALEVISGDRLSQRPRVREERGFVAWPPPGYVPAQTAWGRWSFSLAGADFSDATVAVVDGSGAVQVEVIDRSSNIAEPSIVWAVAGDTNSHLLAAPADGDHCYAVTVAGVTINGAVQTPYEYASCVIDPHAPTGPSVTLDAPDTVDGTFDVSITFSEPVAGFTSEDVFVINGAVQALRGSGREYTATIRAHGSGAVVATVGAGAVHDRHSRPNTAAVPLRRDARVGRPTAELASAAFGTVYGSFDVSITFNTPVSGFSWSGIRTVNGTVSSLTGSGASYRATIEPDSDGTVVVWVREDAATAGGRGNLVSAPLTRRQSPSGRLRTPGIVTWYRDRVVRAYNEDFGWHEPDWGYTGVVASCRAGTTSQAFRDVVLQRLNWYRAMAGLSPAVEDTSRSANAQMTALLYMANNSFEFSSSSRCYSQTGDEISQNSLGWLGRSGIDAIKKNMEHAGTNNKRRNLLMPWLAVVGIGHARDPDPDSTYGVAQVLYTDYSDPWNDPRPAVREERGFVAWPPAGYVIDASVWDKWSFSLPDADFSAATVSVVDHIGPLQVTILGTDWWYREKSIIWSISPSANSDTRPAPTGSDHCYTVTISGVRINSSLQAPYQYAVCLIDV